MVLLKQLMDEEEQDLTDDVQSTTSKTDDIQSATAKSDNILYTTSKTDDVRSTTSKHTCSQHETFDLASDCTAQTQDLLDLGGQLHDASSMYRHYDDLDTIDDGMVSLGVGGGDGMPQESRGLVFAGGGKSDEEIDSLSDEDGLSYALYRCCFLLCHSL